MLIKVISITFNSTLGGFNDDFVREFLKDKELISARDYFLMRNDVPYLVFVLKYLPYRAEIDPKFSTKDKQDEPWRKMLSDPDMGLFNLLRDWRSQRAKKDGVPPYVVFTNNQLAMIVKKRPQSPAELIQIEGIGKAKTEKYGEEVLLISKVNLGKEQEEVPKDGSAT